jgi:hypothetical protein
VIQPLATAEHQDGHKEEMGTYEKIACLAEYAPLINNDVKSGQRKCSLFPWAFLTFKTNKGGILAIKSF